MRFTRAYAPLWGRGRGKQSGLPKFDSVGRCHELAMEAAPA
jgi:hypothetical protein